MPRLTKRQSIEYYGRNLPTPTIEKITLSTVQPDDEIYETLRRIGDTVGAEISTTGLERKLTRIDADISFYFSTDESFDVEEFEKSLFDAGSDEPLYITMYLSYEALSNSDKIFKTNIIKEIDNNSGVMKDAPRIFSRGTLNYGELGIGLLASGRSNSIRLVAEPLSEFHHVAELTPEIDADGNSVIRVSNIKITTYVEKFASIANVNMFCCCSTRHPYEIETPTSFALDPITVSMNYSDITYEQITRNGTLATFSEPAYVDAQGLYYPGRALASINKKFYKTEEYGSKQIFDSVNALLAEYEARTLLDEPLQGVTDEVKAVLAIHQDEPQFLQNLNKIAQGFSVTVTESEAIRFNQRFRDLINNADAILRQQEEVVKRIFRNYKLVDSRDIDLPELAAYSYVHTLKDKDILYQNVFNTNIANYVPIVTAGADYPGKAELPATPAEMVSEFSDDMLLIRQELQDLMDPLGSLTTPAAAVSTGGAPTFTGVTYRTPASFGAPSAATETLETALTPLVNKIDAAVRDMADWCYNVWAGRFIKGSTHPAYQNADGHSGAHYYIVGNYRSGGEDLEQNDEVWTWDPTRDTLGNEGGTFFWDDDAPANFQIGRWERMTSVTPWANWTDQGAYITRASSAAIESHDDDYYDNVLAKFGYYPSRDSDRPDNSPRNGGPVYHITRVLPVEFESNSELVLGPSRTWYWFDRYFWSAISSWQLSGLYYLAQQEHQIEFFVPKDASGFAPTLDEVIEGGIGVDGDGFALGALGETVIIVGGTDRIEDSRFESANVYMSEFYEKVGGVSPLHRNAVDTDRERTNHQLVFDAGSYGDFMYSADFDGHGLGWWRCARKKYNDIYQNVRDTFYSVYGINPDTLEYEAGTAAVVDGPPPADTNTATTLDTYLSQGPPLILEQAISYILEKIDNRPADDFDTEAERDNWTNVYTDLLIERAFASIEAYYDKKFCKMYACTSIPDEEIMTIWRTRNDAITDVTYLPDSIMIKNLDYAYSDGTNTGGDIYPNISYGGWGGLTLSETVEGESMATSNTHIVNLGQAFIDLLKQTINTNRDPIKQTIRRYINTHALFTGFNSDIGIHSALAEVDIVLSKYGYFFFDMEKYIRKRSHLSKVINVDRLLANFPSAKQMTNAGCRLKRAIVKLDNFGIDPATGLTTTSTAAKITLNKRESNITTTSFINDFRSLEFETPVDPVTKRPRVYRRINALQAISFDQITEYTGARDLAITGEQSETFREEAERIMAGSGTPTTDLGETATPDGTIFIDTDLIESIAASIPGTPEDPLGAAAAAQQSALEALEVSLAERLSVDIDSLVSDLTHTPKQLHTGLVMRNYAFPGFVNAALGGGKEWRKDYRMMMFKYQFFLDDDDAFSFANDPELDDGNVSYDKITFDVEIYDNSEEIYYAMLGKFRQIFKTFETDYFNLAEEACAFNSFDQNFNTFFVQQMINTYPAPPNTPWHTMVATYISYTNIMTDAYGGDRVLMYDTGNNLLELIRPETGNLESLRIFYDNCLGLLNKLIEGGNILRTVSGQKEFTFTYEDIIGAPVIDHIGDYSDRLEDPRVSEFGGDEDLYTTEDF
jgi:hypothetical protein